MLLFGLQQGDDTLGGLHCGIHGYCTPTSTLPSGKLFPSTSVCLSVMSVCLSVSFCLSVFLSLSLCLSLSASVPSTFSRSLFLSLCMSLFSRSVSPRYLSHSVCLSFRPLFTSLSLSLPSLPLTLAYSVYAGLMRIQAHIGEGNSCCKLPPGALGCLSTDVSGQSDIRHTYNTLIEMHLSQA